MSTKQETKVQNSAKFYLFLFLPLVIFLLALGGDEDASTVAEDLKKINVPIIHQTASPFLKDSNCPYRTTTQPHGLADSDSNGLGKYHTGFDVACRSGSKLVAPFTCLVTHAQNSNRSSGWGTNVICKGRLLSGKNICLRIAHMRYNSLTVKVGQTVIAGETFGLEGTTGASSGVHAHIQLMECDGDYRHDLDSGYAFSHGFDQYSRFYNPLRFFDEMKDAHTVHTTLNFARHLSNGEFAGHSWISTNPNYKIASDWTNTNANGWQIKLSKRGYGSTNSRVYYKARYLVTNRDNYLVVFKPYLPFSGFWKAHFKVPEDSTLNGTATVSLFWRHQDDGKNGNMKMARYGITQSASNHGKYIPLGGYFYCNKGKDCSVEVATQNLAGYRNFGFEEVKWEFVSPAFENMQGAHVVNANQQSQVYEIDQDTEFGIIRLEYWPGTERFNVDLYADLVKSDGKRVPLPCFRSNIAGQREHCVFLKLKQGERIVTRTNVPNPPYCTASSCFIIVLC